MAEDRIPELETQIGQLQAQQAELRKQLIKARIDYWQGRVDDLEVQLHTGAVETSRKLTAKMDQLRSTWADTKKQWEAAATTTASAGDTLRTGLESAYRELRQALLDARNKLASAHPQPQPRDLPPAGPGAGPRSGAPSMIWTRRA